MVLSRSELVIFSLDDSRDDREIFRKILEHRGFSFLQASYIDEAKTVIQNSVPHIILLDLEIADESGFDFLSYIKKEPSYKDIPVIVVSNHVSSELIAEAISRGASDYMVKPIVSMTLVEKIDKLAAPIMKTRGESYSIPLDSEDGKCVLRFQTHVSRINEFGVFVVGNTYFRNSQSATMTAEILNDINMNTMPKRIVRTTVVDDMIKKRFPSLKYETYLSYVGISEEDCKNIRKYISNNLTSGNKRGK